MKNGFKVLGLIVLSMVIGFSMTACGDGGGGGITITVGQTSGSLTISGLSAYNGKWVFAGSHEPINLQAAQSINSTTFTLSAAPISNGSATLQVWKGEYTETSASFSNYNGNDKNVEFYVDITSQQAIPLDADDSIYIGGGHATVNFTNGAGTGAFTGN